MLPKEYNSTKDDKVSYDIDNLSLSLINSSFTTTEKIKNYLIHANRPIYFPLIQIENNIMSIQNNKNIYDKFFINNEIEDLQKNFSEKLEISLNKKRERVKKGKRNRRCQGDLIRKKIIRHFFNRFLIQKINVLLKNASLKLYFEKFPKYFLFEVAKKRNQKVLKMTLEQLFLDKELYVEKNHSYYHNSNNLSILKSDEYKEIEVKTELDKTLNKTFHDLFRDYLSSYEYAKEIQNIKSKEKEGDDSYIRYYIYYSKKFIENYSNSKNLFMIKNLEINMEKLNI